MKPKIKQNRNQSGFTLIELLVVLAIMVVVSGVIILDFNRNKASRNIVLAKNETVTNLRKVQAYMLSSKNINGSIPARYYIAQFDIQNPTQFVVQAVDKDFNFYDNIETITLPNSVSFQSFSGGGLSGQRCFQLLYSAPFGTMYVRGSNTCNGTEIVNVVRDPVQLASLSQATLILTYMNNTTVQVSPLTGQIYTP